MRNPGEVRGPLLATPAGCYHRPGIHVTRSQHGELTCWFWLVFMAVTGEVGRASYLDLSHPLSLGPNTIDSPCS